MIEKYVLCVNNAVFKKQFIGISEYDGYPYLKKRHDYTMLFCECYIQKRIEYCKRAKDDIEKLGVNVKHLVIRNIETGKDIKVFD